MARQAIAGQQVTGHQPVGIGVRPVLQRVPPLMMGPPPSGIDVRERCEALGRRRTLERVTSVYATSDEQMLLNLTRWPLVQLLLSQNRQLDRRDRLRHLNRAVLQVNETTTAEQVRGQVTRHPADDLVLAGV